MTSLQERLFAMQDKQYAAFQAKLTPGVPVESFIGIRVPVLRKFAKEFTKETECKEFLQQLPHEYYDENMLHGLLIFLILLHIFKFFSRKHLRCKKNSYSIYASLYLSCFAILAWSLSRLRLEKADEVLRIFKAEALADLRNG
jgi:hypothetical protein